MNLFSCLLINRIWGHATVVKKWVHTYRKGGSLQETQSPLISTLCCQTFFFASNRVCLFISPLCFQFFLKKFETNDQDTTLKQRKFVSYGNKCCNLNKVLIYKRPIKGEEELLFWRTLLLGNQNFV